MPGRAEGVDARATQVRSFADHLSGAARLQAAERLRAQADREALDRLAALAAGLLRVPNAQVSLLTDVQVVLGGHGLPATLVGAELPLEGSLCTITAASGGPLVVADASADGRVAAMAPVLEGAVAAFLGVPMVARGAVVGALCVFDEDPRTWTPEDVALLEQLASSAVSELEVQALGVEAENSRLMWELAIDAGGVGTFDWDLSTGRLNWDDRCLELFGYSRADFEQQIASFDARVHPADLPRVTAALDEAIETAGVYESEYRVVLPDGRLRWVGARGRALPDAEGRSVRVVGAAYDTTARHDAEARIGRVLESMSAAFYSIDRGWRFTYVNAEAERLLGRPRAELLGGVLWDLFPATVGSDFERYYTEVMATGQQVTFDAYYPAPLDGWYELRVWPSEDGISVYFLEVSARRAAQRQAEQGAARAALLAEVSGALTDTSDPEAAAHRLADLVVPALGTWSVVTLGEDGARDRGPGTVRVGAGVHPDPLVQRFLDGRVHPGGTERDIAVRLAGEAEVELPLRGRGRALGALLLGGDVEGTALEGARLEVAGEVAERAGLAMDNSRLYRQQRRLVEQLQRSMLTDPPEPDHLEIVVRYLPAAEDAQVGGDWYDAFLQPDGATVLVVGDVVGHDSAAAAAMGQVRTLLRGIAADRGDAPGEVLRRVDQVLAVLQVETTATAVVARFEQELEDREHGVTRFRWANAGHMPPMVLYPDRRSAVLSGPDPDLLLGMDHRTARRDHVLELERGSTVLLYTDGLVERRGQSLDEGLARLRALLEELAGLPLQQLCDQVLARLVPEGAEDDVALVGVRAHRQDGPRPAEAGPRRVPEVVDPEPED